MNEFPKKMLRRFKTKMNNLFGNFRTMRYPSLLATLSPKKVFLLKN